MSETQSKAAATPTLGDVWEVPAKGPEPVVIVRPDGDEVRVQGDGSTALHVLDVPGVYTCGKVTVEVAQP